jgi:hypothetical protein
MHMHSGAQGAACCICIYIQIQYSKLPTGRPPARAASPSPYCYCMQHLAAPGYGVHLLYLLSLGINQSPPLTLRAPYLLLLRYLPWCRDPRVS